MKFIFVMPLAISAVFATLWAACRAARVDPHIAEMSLAAGVSLVAGLLALLPLFLVGRFTNASTSGETVAAIWQAALAGTVVHLLMFIAVGAGAILARVIPSVESFAYWMVVGYWVSLLAVVGSVLYMAPSLSRTEASADAKRQVG